MPLMRTTSSVEACDLSWTTGMPVHPEPMAPAPARLRQKDVRELAVMTAIGVVSILVCLPPLAGFAPGLGERATLSARELRASATLPPAVRPHAPEPPRAAVLATQVAARRVRAERIASRALTSVTPFVARQPLAIIPTRDGVTLASARPVTLVAERRQDPRAIGAKIGRVLLGDGRHRVQPFPRPADFE
jgi:hypothetical protein